MAFDIFGSAKEHIIVAAHRGVAGGNIPCNTMVAYETALKQRADMIEVDLNMSADGVLIIFHPKMERIHLRADVELPKMQYEDISKLRYVNYDGTPTQFGIVRFDDLLENFKGRCYINVDKFWDHPVEIYKAIKRHGMLDQIVVKSSLKNDNVIRVLEDVAPDVAFLPVVRNSHPLHEELMKKNINYIGAEVLFSDETSELASADFVERMHRDGKLLWVNSIIYDCREQLTAGHSDDMALSVSFDEGWGWLAARGYDIIQTDWAQMLVDYLKQSGKYYRK